MKNVNANKQESESQKAQILEWLLCGCKLTSLEGLQYFHCMKVSNRVSELRQDGFPIKTTMVETDFSKKKIAQYSL